MFKLHAIQARFGDCFLLEYGTAAEPKFILIDGGPPGTFNNHLRQVLVNTLSPHGGRLERVILSHVDNDHVGGLLDLFAELQRQRVNEETEIVSIGGLWHNSFTQTLDPDSAIASRLEGLLAINGVRSVMSNATATIQGYNEGGRLRRSAAVLQVPLNPDFTGPIIASRTAVPTQFEGLVLTVVGPTQENLVQLRAAWQRWLDEHEERISQGDPAVMANSDRSVPNLSSICLVATSGGKRMLLTGDQRSDFLLEGLGECGLLDGNTRAHFDLLKVPHHGSDRNITRRFLELVTADRYVISADGTYGNPDLDPLLWIVETAKAQQRTIEIIVTNVTEATRQLLAERPPEDFGYNLKVLSTGTSSIEVALG